MNAIDQQRVANTQRGYLMAILFFFLFFSANDFTPAKTRRNANTGIAGVNKASAETSRRRDEVRDKVGFALEAALARFPLLCTALDTFYAIREIYSSILTNHSSSIVSCVGDNRFK